MKIRAAFLALVWAWLALCQSTIPQNVVEQDSGPAALATGINSGPPLPTGAVWLSQGSWISAGASAATLSLQTGTGSVPEGNSWTIPANTTVYPPEGSKFPGGIVIACSSGCSTANYYFRYRAVTN